MLEIFIKYFAIIFCSIYTYKRLLNLKKRSKYILIDLLFSALLSIGVYFLRTYVEPLSIPAMIAFAFIFMKLTEKTQLELSITTTILSFGISYAFFVISAILISASIKILGVEDSSFVFIYLSIGGALIQLSLGIALFKIKRLKNGIPFLINKGTSSAGVFISIILLGCAIVSSNDRITLIYILPIVFILSGAMSF